MLSSIKAGTAPATLKKVTYRQLVKAAATVRNQTVTYGGATPLELAFGRRPADLIQLDVATPTQLTIDRNEEELTAIQIQQLSKQAFQEARQSEDIRRDLAQNPRMSSKPLQVKDKVFYWQEDKSKIHSDGSKGGIWLKGNVISIEGAIVGLDLGTRLIKVNTTKVRKDAPCKRFAHVLCASWSVQVALRQLLRASALRMCSVQVALRKCSEQVALRKCSAPVAPCKRFAHVQVALRKCFVQLLCAIRRAQVALRKLLCASAAGAVGMGRARMLEIVKESSVFEPRPRESPQRAARSLQKS